MKGITVLFLTLIAATVDDNDFGSVSIFRTFSPGSGDGALMCLPVTVFPDTEAEGDEKFNIALQVVTAGESLYTGNSHTSIILTDDDGIIYVHCK